MGNKFDDRIKRDLDGMRPEFNPADWTAMQDILDRKDQKGAAWWFNPMALAALLLLLAGAVSAWYFTQPETLQVEGIAEKSRIENQIEDVLPADQTDRKIETAKEINNAPGTLTAEINQTPSEKFNSANRNFTPANSSFSLRNNNNSSAVGLTTQQPEIENNDALNTFQKNNSSVSLLSGNTHSVPWFRVTGLDSEPESAVFSDQRNVNWPDKPRRKKGVETNYALVAHGGLNATYTGAGDGFRPSWDAGAGAEIQLNRFYVHTGFRYGKYKFDQQEINCDGSEAFGLDPKALNCATNLEGDLDMYEIPLIGGYIFPNKKGNARFRIFGGPVLQLFKKDKYVVYFDDVDQGEVLFFDPYIINTAGSSDQVELFLEDLGNETTAGVTEMPINIDNTGRRQSGSSSTLALEAGFGYEQFLAKNVSLSAEPRVTVPMNKLLVNDRRPYVASISARLRWYPGAQ